MSIKLVTRSKRVGGTAGRAQRVEYDLTQTRTQVRVSIVGRPEKVDNLLASAAVEQIFWDAKERRLGLSHF